MKAQSKDYAALQSIYRAKAQADVKAVQEKVALLEKELNRTTPIDTAEIEAFCKNAAHIKLMHGRKLLIPPVNEYYPLSSDKTERWKALTKKVEMENSDDAEPIPGFEPSLLGALVAFQAFEHARYEGESPVADPPRCFPGEGLGISKPIRLLRMPNDRLYNADMGVADKILDEDVSKGPLAQRALDVAKELVRAQGQELHNISALTGGLVGQEVIKVITKQYVPVDNTCIFDGVKSRSETFRI